jgi:pantoate--beta-alanine ligase
MVKSGQKDARLIKKSIEELLTREPLLNLEYISICETTNLEEVDKIEGEILIALAAQVGKARLIDNIFLSA